MRGEYSTSYLRMGNINREKKKTVLSRGDEPWRDKSSILATLATTYCAFTATTASNRVRGFWLRGFPASDFYYRCAELTDDQIFIAKN